MTWDMRCFGFGGMLFGLLLSGLLLSVFSSAVMAQQPSQAQIGAIKQSCRSDYQSFCSSVPTGGRAALECLEAHLPDLSGACHNAVGAVTGGGTAQSPSGASPQAGPPPGAAPRMSMRQKAAMMRRSCGGDFQTYCRGVQPGGGRAIACLSENEARLSPACQGALAQARPPL